MIQPELHPSCSIATPTLHEPLAPPPSYTFLLCLGIFILVFVRPFFPETDTHVRLGWLRGTIFLKVCKALALGNSNSTLFSIPKSHFIIISYHFTIPLVSQNSIFIKILFFNLSLLFLSNCHFFLDLA